MDEAHPGWAVRESRYSTLEDPSESGVPDFADVALHDLDMQATSPPPANASPSAEPAEARTSVAEAEAPPEPKEKQQTQSCGSAPQLSTPATGRRRLGVLLGVGAILVLFAAVGAAALLVPTGSPHASATVHSQAPDVTHVLRGSFFSTAYPASWSERSADTPQGALYQLSSRSLPAASQVPPAGTVDITVEAIPFSSFENEAVPARVLSSPAATLTLLNLGFLKGKSDVTALTAPPVAGLGGTSAAVSAYQFGAGSAAMVRDDVLAVRGQEVVIVEMDTAPSLRSDGESALSEVIANWEWAG